jgi:flagellar basal body-associated protein FliL
MKKSSQRKSKLRLVVFILMLLLGVGNLLWLLLKNNFYASSDQVAAQSGSYLTLIATILFVVSSMAGIVIVLSDMRDKP